MPRAAKKKAGSAVMRGSPRAGSFRGGSAGKESVVVPVVSEGFQEQLVGAVGDLLAGVGDDRLHDLETDGAVELALCGGTGKFVVVILDIVRVPDETFGVQGPFFLGQIKAVGPVKSLWPSQNIFEGDHLYVSHKNASCLNLNSDGDKKTAPVMGKPRFYDGDRGTRTHGLLHVRLF